MKQLTKRLKSRRHASIVLLPLLLLLIGLNSNAQPFWPPTATSIADDGGGGVQDTRWVNCDMYNVYPTTGPGASLFPVTVTVWDRTTVPELKLMVFDPNSGNWNTYQIPNAQHPDIILGDDISTPGQLKLAIVYENTNTGDIDMATLDINPTAPGFGSATISTTSVVAASAGVTLDNPHIDMAPNSTTTAWGLTQLDDYVFTWCETTGGTGAVKLQTGTLSTGASTTTPINIDNGTMPDVAYVYDRARGGNVAYFTYFDPGTSELKQASYDFSSTAITTQVLEAGITVTAPPRIEALNIQNGSPTTVWQAVAEVAGTLSEIHGYREVAGSPLLVTNYSSLVIGTPNRNPLARNDGYSPAVAAGNGLGTYGNSSDYGNQRYSMGWFINNAEWEAINVLQNTTVNASAGYAQINSNPAQAALIVGLGGNLLGMTNGSNDGAGLFSAFMATDISSVAAIMVKYSGNTFAFKPNDVGDVELVSGWLVNPNPAVDNVTIRGKHGTDYSLTDMTGRILMTGTTTTSTENISINHLPQGMYLLQLRYGTETKTVKLAKQ